MLSEAQNPIPKFKFSCNYLFTISLRCICVNFTGLQFLNGVAEGFYCGFEGFEGGGAFHTGGL